MFEPTLENIVSALTIIGLLAKGGWVVFKFARKQYLNLTRVHDQVDKIFKEIIPNGGGSIKDKVNFMSKEIITNTKMTEQIFHRQRWMMDHRAEAIFEAQLSGEYFWVNKPYCKLVGRDSSHLLGHNWKNTILEEDRERVVSNWEASVKDERNFEDEYRIIMPDGKIIKVVCSANPVCGHGYIGSLQLATDACVSCPAHKDEKKL
jgi:PAS domain S-box-containing protein